MQAGSIWLLIILSVLLIVIVQWLLRFTKTCRVYPWQKMSFVVDLAYY